VRHKTIFNQSPINISDEVFEGALESFLAIRGKIIKQKERVRNKQQKQSEHKFSEFNQLYSLSDIPDGK